MKSLRITLGVAAIALGTFTAFSFAPAKVDSKVTTGIRYVNPNGSMGDAYDPSNHPCEGEGDLCAQEYTLETQQPTEENKIFGVRRP
ncbi:hypothetical protein DRF65_11255 [Chryseobacterium pennae]|uniref:Uncharacterized protein n=1 Tax=Chryseobacterium pennae TaxID=2258962 RepID=A0A3D9C8U5_9FLAO|nr:hypothetical protein [Chryseobacterium pennae]REC62283.1 hypothetical protein DRF65_11255 [Chryseobacterium pennae]